MRAAGRLVLGHFPLPVVEAERIRKLLLFPSGEFTALDPCVGHGTAFNALLGETQCHRYGIELDAFRAVAARTSGITVLQADVLQVRGVAESVSLLYENPPYDFEIGPGQNRRFETLFIEHTLRWLKRGGVLVFVIPQRQLAGCATILAEYFTDLRIFQLTASECVRYRQVVVLGVRRPPSQSFSDREYNQSVEYLKDLADSNAIDSLTERETPHYQVPTSGPATFTSRGIPLDQVEDVMPASAAYIQVSRLLLRQPNAARGRPITPLHQGHVGLVATSGLLNGVFGQGTDRHISNWRPAKTAQHSEEEEEDGTIVRRDWESFSHKLALLFADGTTMILGHQRPTSGENGDDLVQYLGISGKQTEPRTIDPHIELGCGMLFNLCFIGNSFSLTERRT